MGAVSRTDANRSEVGAHIVRKRTSGEYMTNDNLFIMGKKCIVVFGMRVQTS